MEDEKSYKIPFHIPPENIPRLKKMLEEAGVTDHSTWLEDDSPESQRRRYYEKQETGKF